MKLNPKGFWKSIRVLDGGDMSHHAFPTIIRMRLPYGELTTTDAENASLFGPHFHRVFNNRRLIDWPVLDKIKQIYVMEYLDQFILWYEIKNPLQS